MRENIIIQIKSYSIFFYAYWNPPTWLNDVPTFWIIPIEKLPFGVRVPMPQWSHFLSWRIIWISFEIIIITIIIFFFFLNNLNFIRNSEHSNSHHNITYEIYFYFVRIKIYLSFNQIKKYGANFLKNRGKKCGANLRVLFIPLNIYIN